MARGTAEETKGRIRTAATELFRERGIAGVSVREIGAAASTDPALVIRHFGSKELLFLETMQVDPEHARLLEGPVEDLGRSYLRFLLAFPDETRTTFLALLRGSGEAAIAAQLRHAHVDLFVAPLRAHLIGDDADLRARLAASLIGGLLYAMWVVGDVELLATDPSHIVERYGALLQQLITPPV